MPPIIFINPSDPGIIQIARNFNDKYEGRKSLLAILTLAWRNDSNARSVLENETILTQGAIDIREGNSASPYVDYLHAVALAQRRIKREGDELLQFKRLVKKNYPKTDQLKVIQAYSQVAESCGNDEKEANFWNYIIDVLINIANNKKFAFQQNINVEDDSCVDIGEIDSELTSGEYGFRLDNRDSERICDLVQIAATTPWQDIN